MKKIITTTILTTAILTLGLLQGAGTAYAAFSQKSFFGHYGGTFYGNVFSAPVDTNDDPGPLEEEIGILTFKHIGIADGIGKYDGELIFNTTVKKSTPFSALTDVFSCNYEVISDTGQVNLTCSTMGQTNEEIDLQCVLIPSLSVDILRELGIHHRKSHNLKCVGTVTLEVGDGAGGTEFWVTNITGEAINRD